MSGHRASKKSAQTESEWEWSEWEWNKNHGRYQRWRLTPSGEKTSDIELWNPYDSEQTTTAQQPECGLSKGQLIEDTTCDNNVHEDRASTDLSAQYNPTTGILRSKRLESLKKGYKFKFGKIFKVFWSEPQGTSGKKGDMNSYTDINQGRIRCFVVNSTRGHCLCLPILTYSSPETTMSPYSKAAHTLAYQTPGKSHSQTYDESKLANELVQVAGSINGHELHTASRINCAKVYTCGQNVKVYKEDASYSLTHCTHCNSIYSRDVEAFTHQEGAALVVMEDDIARHMPRDGGGSTHELRNAIIVRDEDGQRYIYFPTNGLPLEDCPPLSILRRSLIAVHVSSGLGMGVDFLWLSKSMGFKITSPVMNFIVDAFIDRTPAAMSKFLHEVPAGVIFASFAAATAIFTGTTFAWVARTKSRTPIILSSIMVGLWILFWLMLGVTVEELILVCVPLSISFGILASCFCSQKHSHYVAIDKRYTS